MDPNTGDKQMKCFICDQEITTSTIESVYEKELELCDVCITEFSIAINALDIDLRNLRRAKINKWLKNQQSVKRFYRRQRKLPLEEGKK